MIIIGLAVGAAAALGRTTSNATCEVRITVASLIRTTSTGTCDVRATVIYYQAVTLQPASILLTVD